MEATASAIITPIIQRIVVEVPAKTDISTAIVAWIGLIISLVNLGIVYLAFKRDRTKIRVKITNGFATAPMPGYNGLLIFIEAINDGRRPITLKGAGFLLDNNETMISPHVSSRFFPAVLNEGESISVPFEKDELTKSLKGKGIKITYGWFDDARGKRHKAKYKFN